MTVETIKTKEEDSTEREEQKQEKEKTEEQGKATNVVEKLGAGIAAIGKR